MPEIARIMEDERPIRALGVGSEWIRVGREAVTRIVPYEENGQMAPVTWFAIFSGEAIIARVAAGADTRIEYEGE